MKIVVLDGHCENPGDLSWGGFEALGQLTVYERTAPDDVIKRIGDAAAVIVNKVAITKEVMDACPNIKYVGILATGYNIVDIDYASEKGITVTNIPTYGTTAVAQMVFALLLEMCHHVGHHSDEVHAGRWSNCEDFCFWDYPLIELAGKTLGIIGFGRIGEAVANIAKAFSMDVLVYTVPERTDGGWEYVSFDELLRRSDVITLHCPLFPETKGMINKDAIDKMKDGVMLINTSRGPLIVEDDLVDALKSKKVYMAALDVVEAEPIPADSKLLGLESVIITPHIAWAPLESRARLMDIAVDNLKSFLSGESKNVVNEL